MDKLIEAKILDIRLGLSETDFTDFRCAGIVVDDDVADYVVDNYGGEIDGFPVYTLFYEQI